MGFSQFAYYWTLIKVAARNSWLHRSKNIIISGLLGLGAFLIVIGYSILKNVEDSMQDSIISSVAAHLQVYSSAATDPLALFGGGFMGREDIDSIPDYKPVKDLLLKNDQVADVIPMGFDMSILSRGNELDDSFDEIRKSLRKGSSQDLEEAIFRAQDQIKLLRNELEYEAPIVNSADKIEVKKHMALIDALSPNFWRRVQMADEMAIMHLEAKIAPISGEKSPIYLRYNGTDPGHFAKAFQKFRIIEGTTIPEGQRGLLLAKRVREDYLKNIVARILDQIQKKCVMTSASFTEDAECKRLVQDLGRQYLEILVYLSRSEIQELQPQLQKILNQAGDISNLIKSFLRVDTESFAERRKFFYEHIAPKIKLYEISPGERIILRTYTKSGYIKTVSIPVYGVFCFDGIEDSEIAGSFNIIDLVSFRELYGQMTEASKQELLALKKEAAIPQVDQENIEAQLFATDNPVEESTTREGIASDNLGQTKMIPIERAVHDDYDKSELQAGLALNLAVFLKDKSRLTSTLSELQKSVDSAGLKVRVVDWRLASGFVGQFVEVIRYVLSISIGIILIVALIIINNTLIVSVFGRTREIGTLRAIGMQKTGVMLLFLVETTLVALIGIVPGLVLGVGTLRWLHFKGIAATHDVIVFLFSGPLLRPTVNPTALVFGPLVILLLAAMSALWVSRRAAAIEPAHAMQEKE